MDGVELLSLLSRTSGKAGANNNGEVFAITNKFGSGETLWVLPCFSLGALPSNTKPLSLLAHSELSEVLHQQPFYFRNYSKGALLRILKSENQYLTVATNNGYDALKLELVDNVDLSPQIIFGEVGMFNKGTVSLKGRETLVLLWR